MLLLVAATGTTLGCLGANDSVVVRNPALLSKGLENRSELRSRLASSCDVLSEVDTVIAQAISIGAPIYNAGSPLGCFRIYEGAAYKLLYELGSDCPELRSFLGAGLAQARADESINRKAWTLRRTFDAVLGEATATNLLPETPL